MTRSPRVENQIEHSDGDTAIYIYGIVPGDVEVKEDAEGIGDPPAKVEVIREGDIAALVSAIPAGHPLGKPKDLQAHANLLDGTAAVAPVLPLRFGAVMTDAEAVAEELLRANHDDFARVLSELEGRAEYIIKGRYDEDALLRDVLSERQARALLDDVRSKPDEASRDSRIALGELIAKAIESRRNADTKTVVDQLNGLASAVNVRPPTHEYDAVHVALMAELDRQPDLEATVNELAEKGKGRTELRLLGPLAAYDFVTTRAPAS